MSQRGWLTPENPPGPLTVCRTTHLPLDAEYLALVGGALSELAQEFNWEKHGAQTIEDTVAFFKDVWLGWYERNLCMLGSIVALATAVVPDGMLLCDGANHLRVDHPELYAVLDPVYIVDADNFIVPNLRQRVIQGAGPPAQPQGGTGGQRTVILEQQHVPNYQLPNAPHTHIQLPHGHTSLPHTHTEIGAITTPDAAGALPVPAAQVIPSVTGPATVLINNTTAVNRNGWGAQMSGGNDIGHENRPPFHNCKYAIIAR